MKKKRITTVFALLLLAFGVARDSLLIVRQLTITAPGFSSCVESPAGDMMCKSGPPVQFIIRFDFEVDE